MIRIGPEGLPIIPPDKDKFKKVEKTEKPGDKANYPKKRREEDNFELSSEGREEVEKNEKDKISPDNE